MASPASFGYSAPQRMRARPPSRRSQPRLLPLALFALVSSVAYAGCLAPPETPTIATTIQPGTTSISVDPGAFLGAVECSNLTGAMQSYVATVTDVTGHFVLASSPPTPCSQSAYFEDVIVGDIFTAVVDGYEESADQLVPTCGAPPTGGPKTCPQGSDAECAKASAGTACLADGSCGCKADSDCPTAYGCQGRCLVSVFLNEDISCLERCLPAPDAGAGTASSATIASFASCVATNSYPDSLPAGNCASTSLNGYLRCVSTCEVDATPGGAMGDADNAAFMECLANLNDCLVTDIPQLQAECTSAPKRATGGIPDGGVSLDGGQDVVLTGEVQACTCVYPIAEGDRNMYSKKTGEPVQPRWQTPSVGPAGAGGPLCGQSFGKLPLSLCHSDGDCEPGRLCEPLPPGTSSTLGSYCDPQSQPYANVSITPCTIDDMSSGAGVTKIQVDAGALLASSPMAQPGAPLCVSAPTDGGTGEVTTLDVVPIDPSVTAVGQDKGLKCSPSTTVTFAGGLVADTPYGFTVIAYDGSASPAYSACCFVTARAGVLVSAMCDPLAPVADAGVVACQCPGGGPGPCN